MTHGTETGYVYHRCRCGSCRAAATVARRGRVKIERRVGKGRGAATVFKQILEHDWALQKLRTDRAYRELIRQRVSTEQKRRNKRETRLLRSGW